MLNGSLIAAEARIHHLNLIYWICHEIDAMQSIDPNQVWIEFGARRSSVSALYKSKQSTLLSDAKCCCWVCFCRRNNFHLDFVKSTKHREQVLWLFKRVLHMIWVSVWTSLTPRMENDIIHNFFLSRKYFFCILLYTVLSIRFGLVELWFFGCRANSVSMRSAIGVMANGKKSPDCLWMVEMKNFAWNTPDE